jgi:GGDEF domain-containing protein
MTDQSWEDARYLSYIEDEFEGLAIDIKAIRQQFKSKLVFSRVAPTLRKMVGFFEFIDSYIDSPQEREKHGRLALIFGDIADFKHINSRAGMATGDQVICKVGAKLDELSRRFGDVYNIHGCYHISGDEFLMVVSANKVTEIGKMLVSELGAGNMTYTYYVGEVKTESSFKLGFGAALMEENFVKHDVASDATRREVAEAAIKDARSQAELACFVAKVMAQDADARGVSSQVGFCRYEDVPKEYLERRITERPKCTVCLTQFNFDIRESLHGRFKAQPFACPVCIALKQGSQE